MTEPTWTATDEVNALAKQPPAADDQYPGLATSADPDWQSFLSSDPDWFLRAAGRTIRRFCGWHIYPNLRVTVSDERVGSWGIISLPSRYVTGVDNLSLSVGDNQYQLIPPDKYVWHKGGWMQLRDMASWDYFTPGYYYGNDQYYLPAGQSTNQAQITFWHGYATVPPDVKEVLFELTQQAMTQASGNLKTAEVAGGFKVELSQNFGLTLNPEQKNRLATYRIGMVK